MIKRIHEFVSDVYSTEARMREAINSIIEELENAD